MVKLSELNKDDVLLWISAVSVDVVTVEEVLNTIESYKNTQQVYPHLKFKLYTTSSYYASIDAREMMMDAIEYECQSMHEDWDLDVIGCITEEDVQAVQAIMDRILDAGGRKTYIEDEEVEIDL